MNILITGGAGFIGSNLADYFLRKGDEVTVFDNLSRKGTEKNLEWLRGNHKELNFIKGDIRKFDQILSSVKDIDAVFHCCAQTAVTTSIKNPREDFEINALGTFNVLEAVRQSKKNPIIIFCSTNKVYGSNVNKIPLIEKETRYEFADEEYKFGIPESFPTDATKHTPYGCSKYTGDLYVRDYYEIYGLRNVTLRMSCCYGIRQWGTEDQGWLAHFVISSVFGKPLIIFGDGRQVRDVLFIDDLIKAFELAIENINKTKGQVYNIGGGPENTISLLELLSMLNKIGLKPKYSFDAWRSADQKVYISDIRKAKEFGWEPKISVKDGVRKLVEWVNTNKNLFQKHFLT